MKGRHALNLVPQRWTLWDRLQSLAYTWKPSTLPAVRVDELFSLRHHAVFICAHCALRYRDGIRRHAYVRHPDMKVQGNPCDFCREVKSQPIPIWFREESVGNYPTLNESTRMAREARAPFQNFRPQLPSRPAPRKRGGWVPNTPEARRNVICVP